MQNLSQSTVTFLIDGRQVLLGYKKTGFGSGKYLGIGGKVEENETIEQAATREVKEEIVVEDLELEKVADLNFYFPEKPTWSQQVHVYLTKKWQNIPQETEEIRPEWFSISELPLQHMWDDAQFWLPAILNGHKIIGMFTFDTNLKVIKLELHEASF